MFRFLARFGIDAFLIGLVSMVGLAWLLPDLGKSGGLIHLDTVAVYGVALVFLLYGLTLPPERMKAGLLNWRLHLLVQLSTFVLFPVLIWGLAPLLTPRLGPDLTLGFFFLAALPSTISSSVAMTSIAKGNVAGAIFNATLSSLLGVVLTPLWVNWYLSSSGASLDLAQVLLKIMLLVLLPIVLGQLLRPRLKDWIGRNMSWLKTLDRITILMIVFNSFADSVAEGIWEGQGHDAAVQAALGSLALFLAVFGVLSLVCRLLGFGRDDSIAGVFCGTKKSLATGVPMAKIMFGASPALGMIIAPTILYHLIQLILAGIIARRLAERTS